MKIVCKQENLIKGLTKVVHLTGKNFNLPILNNVLFKVEKGKIELVATNLEIGIKTQVRGRVEQEGKITVPAKIITDYVSLISENQNVILEVQNDNLLVLSEEWQTKIKSNPAEDYPLIPEVQEKKKIKLKLSEFKQALNQVVFAASFDETRPELTGVFFGFNNNQMVLAATDSYRLAEKKIKIDNNLKQQEKNIVPLKTVQELIRIIGDEEDDEIEISFDDNQVKFFFNETNVVSRLIEGEYPDYQQIIPENYTSQIEIDTYETLKAVKAASLFTKTGIFDVTLEFLRDKLLIKSVNAQLGENEIKLKALNQGQETLVVFNYKYLLDGLGNINSPKTKIFINSPANPIVFKPINNNDYTYLVMPIRQ